MSRKSKDNTFVWSNEWWLEDSKAWFICGMSNVLFCIDFNTGQCENWHVFQNYVSVHIVRIRIVSNLAKIFSVFQGLRKIYGFIIWTAGILNKYVLINLKGINWGTDFGFGEICFILSQGTGTR